MKKLLLTLVAALALLTVNAQERNFRFTPADKLRYAYAVIESFYVDSVNSGEIVEEAIVAMLKELDPHSDYTNPEETKDLNESIQGNFSGIGIQFNMLNDTLFVIQTTAGGPAEKVGMIAGDRILSANDTLISGVGKKNSDIIKTLRGPKGSICNVKVQRRGEADPIEFRITRDDIPIYSIDAVYMADPTTGYIKISRFSETTDREFVEAMEKLRGLGMKNLIIDLQSNGGGLLGASTDISQRFLRNGDMIVYTKGRTHNPVYFNAEGDGDFLNGRIVILVDQYSASASEILSGALQDNDRALIVGRRTFGKGLVQRPMPFPDGSMIKLTTSRYYTPSGRCIQKPYEAGDEDAYRADLNERYEHGELMHADSVKLNTEDKHMTLRNGRTVYGGGGIMPDLFVPIDTSFYSTYYRDLVAKGTLNQYCITYVDENRDRLKELYPTEDKFLSDFVVTDEIIDGIIKRGEADGVAFDETGFETSRDWIKTIVNAIIGRDLFETGTYYRVVNEGNPVYVEGLKLINDAKRYTRLLKP